MGPRFENRVRFFEEAQPNAAELSRGDMKQTEEVLENIADWITHIEINGDKQDRETMVPRLERARRRYRTLAAKLVRDPVQAIALILSELESGDPGVMAVLEERSQQELARRKAEQNQNGTYHLVRENIEVREHFSFANGQQLSASRSVRDPGPIGNCVFVTRPFGPDRQPNPGFSLLFYGEEPVIFARCYSEENLGALPGDGFLVAVVAGDFDHDVVRLDRAALARTAHSIDFRLPQTVRYRPRASAAGYVPVEVAYMWAPDNRIVVDRNGELRVRPDWRRRVIAKGGFVWRRD